MYLNTRHINHSAPRGVFGGAMCICRICTKMQRRVQDIPVLEILQEANGLLDEEEGGVTE